MKLTKKQIAALILSGSITLTTSGCIEKELAPDVSEVDLLETNNESSEELNNGVTQIKQVQGEEFSLIIGYISGDKDWRINANKKLYIEIKTKDLPDNKEVYIDNIHMDTSIVSTKAGYNGILQDTMDDRIHNSLMLGFPISNTNSYFGINEIEGENAEFLEGYVYGAYYYTSGSLETKRRLESDYLSDGVWANKIDSVIDLIIINKDTNELRQVSVDSSLLVEVNDKIEFKTENGNIIVYDYERDGSRKEVKKLKK